MKSRNRPSAAGLAWALLLGAPLAAQPASPGHFAGAEGNARAGAGLGSTALPCRQLQIHEDLAGAPMVIRGLALRRDGGAAGAYAPFGIVGSLFLSTARAAALDANFDANHGPDRIQVLASSQVAFPATLPGIPPRPFEYVLPFALPFLFGGQGPLCWDLLVLARGNAFPVDLDAADGIDANPSSPYGTEGAGCLATGQGAPFALRIRPVFDWPRGAGALQCQGLFGPMSGIGQLYLGVHRGIFGGVALPFELPGTRQGASGPCWLQLTPIAILPVGFDAAGAWSAGFGLALVPALHGTTLLAQLLALDPPANNWRMVLSEGAWVHVVAPWRLPRVGAVTAETPPFTAGAPSPGRGAVVQFR